MTVSAERAVELIKELQRKPDTVPPYNTDGVRQVYDEIRTMADSNARDVQVRWTRARYTPPHVCR